MKKFISIVALLAVFLTACSFSVPSAAPTYTGLPTQEATQPQLSTDTVTPTATLATTDTPTATTAPLYPPEGYGPDNFPTDVDPLTGIKVADPSLLERRPLMVKVQNLPRFSRPQWGLSLADLVFEYYAEEGGTRFAAIYLGQNANTVGPIRSGRFIDDYLMRGYKPVLAYGSAYEAERNRFYSSNYANRIVVEWSKNSPLTRYDPQGYNYLVVNTANLSAYATAMNMSNTRQDLNGMFFKMEPPAGGQPVNSFFVHYSTDIYNRWDYDPNSGKFLRFSDTTEAFGSVDSEKYAQLTDRLTGAPIADDNVLVLKVNNSEYSPNIYDILLNGDGDGWAFRDGQIYPVKWHRAPTSVVTLTNPDGSPFALKPGNTWFEIIGLSSTAQQMDQLTWRFTHYFP